MGWCLQRLVSLKLAQVRTSHCCGIVGYPVLDVAVDGTALARCRAFRWRALSLGGCLM
jgi:hypothetical protein